MVSQIYMYIKMYQNLHLIMGILYLNKAVFKNDNFRKMYEAITLLVLGWNPKSDNLPPPSKKEWRDYQLSILCQEKNVLLLMVDR